MSSGEFVFIVDSDFELPPNLIEDCVMACETGFDCARIHEVFVGVNYWSRCRALEQRTYWGDDVIEVPRFMRRKTYDAVAGFDETLTAGEDYDFGQKLASKTLRIYTSRFIIRHHETGDLRTIVMKKHFYGKTMDAYLRKHGDSTLRDFALVRLGWIRQRNLLINDPLHACGIFVIKWLQYTASLIGFAQATVGHLFSRRES